LKKLVIVESPSKSKTIHQYLGSDFEVLSSKGHIRDLAIAKAGGLGLDIENGFQPIYAIIKGKESIVKELKKAAANAEEIYLATDPDREGEAISWHLKEILDIENKPYFRVIFNEVTRAAIEDAFKNPRSIDDDLVSSQETRRIIDRIIGFKLSKLLQNKIKSKSAGRVQSVALKILVEREKEIQAFVPEEFWKIKARFKALEADLKISSKKHTLPNEKAADTVFNELQKEYLVTRYETKIRERATKPAFITSTLQQEASNKLNMSGQRTMVIAQKLYEGIQLGKETVGLITYMRTDSTRLSQTFVQPGKEFIESHYGKEYVGKVSFLTSKKAQDAHEAIRPTSVEYTPESIEKYLTKDELKVYQLIYRRALASLMSPAKISGTALELTNGKHVFESKAQELVFDGYLKLYGDYEKVETTELPPLKENDVLTDPVLEKSQHFTQAPPRYTEAKLIKTMEALGIGRPSTYAQTIATLKKRQYVAIEEKKFVPTEQGILTVENLGTFFDDIINVDYTANMETLLDDIATSGKDHLKIVEDFYQEFMPMVEKANKEMQKKAPKLTGEKCPQCGSPMVERESRYGTFEACSGYPDCKYIKPNEQTAAAPVETGITCPSCKKGSIVERVAKKGRNKGNVFYACNNFPKCKTILKGKPTGELCPNCDQPMVTLNDGSVVCNDVEACENQPS
jgi:DNA topoisomerase-1